MVTNNDKLDQRKKKALDLRRQGYNCSQAVVMAFPELIQGVDQNILAAMSVGLGGGVVGKGEICGCASSLAMLTGLKIWQAPTDKKEVYAEARTLIDMFAENNGALQCRDLKRPGARKTCKELIEDAVTIMHHYLSEDRR